MKEGIINTEIERTVQAIKYFAANEEIGERELRKVLN